MVRQQGPGKGRTPPPPHLCLGKEAFPDTDTVLGSHRSPNGCLGEVGGFTRSHSPGSIWWAGLCPGTHSGCQGWGVTIPVLLEMSRALSSGHQGLLLAWEVAQGPASFTCTLSLPFCSGGPHSISNSGRVKHKKEELCGDSRL